METPGRQSLPSLASRRPELRAEYVARLDAVDDELVGAALLVVDAMPGTIRCLLRAERACIREAHAIASEVRARTRLVEEQAFLLLARESPVSGDLRRLVALLRLVTDVERAARLLHHIASCVDRLDVRLLPGPLQAQLAELATRSAEVLRCGVDAWRGHDALAVHELDRADAEVDELRTRLLLRARALEDAAGEALVLGLLGRYLERMADHGVAFAQHMTFVVTGDRVDVGP